MEVFEIIFTVIEVIFVIADITLNIIEIKQGNKIMKRLNSNYKYPIK